MSAPQISIIRENATETFTQGRLTCGSTRLYTLELPWKDNERSKSRIPPGNYRARVLPPSHKYPYVHIGLEEEDVIPREGIFIVAGETAPAIAHGCIAVGIEFKNGSLLRSDVAIKELVENLKRMGHDVNSGFLLDIKEELREGKSAYTKEEFQRTRKNVPVEHAPQINELRKETQNIQ